ncbi:MAG: DUF1127 domain-containing protein [Vannielia sp.]|uniref:DUF1127 domain-containing protein n=1 Tax=Rhodobacterales TaxID=204455 RepID=UPI0020945CAA|nr:DUF1127 domain-containing protein [Oceanicola sp. 502str15]MCO6381383.1 DUF1127 domain-containing protein [Oceanicola sp. 502str15]
MSTHVSPLSSGALSGCHPATRSGLLARALGMLALRRQRLALARLDATLLKDIGISAEEARSESTRRLWDVPPGWRT